MGRKGERSRSRQGKPLPTTQVRLCDRSVGKPQPAARRWDSGDQPEQGPAGRVAC